MKKEFIYLSPLIAFAIAIVILYKGVQCLKKKKKSANQNTNPKVTPLTRRLDSIGTRQPVNSQSRNPETSTVGLRLSLAETRQVYRDGQIQELNIYNVEPSGENEVETICQSPH